MVLTAELAQNDPREPITETIITTIADAEGVDVLELPPLWNVVDPEALEELFAPSKRGQPRCQTGCVTVQYYGYEITIEYGEPVTVSIE
ncbi:hypothetical protein GS429_12610 [Natronorubrum sp. JWXQ-INN-674]|uniref:Halobacterial output domain-containing protein n=1 Tax=Natronorubrum halalkaliphilum TaxID=2691917 RepID=A0A6B0VP11_9EURY|nr:HalOD1 output domain-containing protein [Natronorubrum halalkaliphilum]MXV62893.1 hypothetical protein [Natronorubrum halalkaliphilum]